MGTVPVPYQPVAGDDATQARVLTWSDACKWLLGTATSGGSRRPLCIMRQAVAQSVANATNTAITFDTEEVDYDNGHSTATNTSRYTAATAGYYFVTYTIAFAANATGWRLAWLKTNGTTDVPGSRVELPGAATAVDGQGFNGSKPVFLNAGDYVELFCYQNSTAALSTVVGAPMQSMMAVEWRSN